VNERLEFDEKEEFLKKLKELITSGVNPKRIEIITPYFVEEVEELLEKKPSMVRFFTFLGSIFGLFFGFFLTSFTVLNWKLQVGGKPLVSIPSFIIIAFELTILFGSLFSFFGFLLISGIPNIKKIISPEDHNNKFIIILKGSDKL